MDPTLHILFIIHVLNLKNPKLFYGWLWLFEGAANLGKVPEGARVPVEDILTARPFGWKIYI